MHLRQGSLGRDQCRNYEKILCCGDVGAGAADYLVAGAEDAASVTEGEAEKTRVKDGLQEGVDDKLGELHVGIARYV